jgi:peptide/nickel transport system permease protein
VSADEKNTALLPRLARRRLPWLRRNRKLQVGLAMLAPFVVFAIMPSVLAPHLPDELLAGYFSPPFGQFALGTDSTGRDILSRLIYSSQTDLMISLGSTAVAAVIGIAIGLLVGYRGGWVNSLTLRVTDVMLAFPSILLALFLITIVGRSDWIIILALSTLFVPGFIRVARGLALSLRERAFVQASVLSGGSAPHVVRRHLLPNAIGTLLVGFALTAAYALLAAATLSYLGLGPPPPAPSWGTMLQDAFGYPFQAWWYGVFPGFCIAWVALAYLLVSQGIEHAVSRGPGGATVPHIAEGMLPGSPATEAL